MITTKIKLYLKKKKAVKTDFILQLLQQGERVHSVELGSILNSLDQCGFLARNRDRGQDKIGILAKRHNRILAKGSQGD